MNALTLLTDQHDVVDALFAKIEAARDGERKRALFEELADALAAHAMIEETLFYPSIKARQTEDLLLESTEEHLAIKRVLADMLGLDVDDDHFDAKLSVVKEQVAHHAREEEEAKLFPKVRKMLGTDELDALGGEMLRLFEEAMAGDPRRTLPGETAHAAAI